MEVGEAWCFVLVSHRDYRYWTACGQEALRKHVTADAFKTSKTLENPLGTIVQEKQGRRMALSVGIKKLTAWGIKI